MKKVTIEVTKEDIQQGKPHNVECCPVALALQRCGIKRPIVAYTHAEYENSGKLRFPEEATRFIFAFDMKRPVEPITFEAEVER